MVGVATTIGVLVVVVVEVLVVGVGVTVVAGSIGLEGNGVNTGGSGTTNVGVAW